MKIALAHDYLTQRGGAERVVLSLTRAFPGSPLHTTLFEPAATFPEFAEVDVRSSPLNRWGLLRRSHRLAMPFLASTVSQMTIDADVVVASSSGWAHGMHTDGRKIVYCHAPARWLYQTDRYAGANYPFRSAVVRSAMAAYGPSLRQWDRRAAESADLYLVNSSAVRTAVADAYGIEATVLHPPVTLLPQDDTDAEPAFPDIERPFVLCVARLLPYKNVDLVIDAIDAIDAIDLVVVGDGPQYDSLRHRAARSGRSLLAGTVSDAQLRWLYRNCRGVIAASYEDFGLSPLEAGAFGKPVTALRGGGYLDTVAEHVSGVYFDHADVHDVARAIEVMLAMDWDAGAIKHHVDSFSEQRFIARMRAVVGIDGPPEASVGRDDAEAS